MKNLTKLLFCIFALSAVVSCEPEEIGEVDRIGEIKEIQPVPLGDAVANDQGEVLDDKKG